MSSEQPPDCATCPCPGRGFSQPEGLGVNGVLAVGEASGDHEYRDRLPFRPQARAGSVLERAFRRLGVPREQFKITNLLRCQPKGNWLGGAPWEQGAIQSCRVHLDAVVDGMRPRCLLALGTVPLRSLTEMTEGILMLRGYVLHSDRYGIPVVGTYHPSYLQRSKGRDKETGAKTESGAGKGGMHLLGVFYLDIRKALEVAQHGWAPVLPQYVTRPSHDEAESFTRKVEDNPNLLVAYDIETPESKVLEEDTSEDLGHYITQIQFSIAPGTGICFPWKEPFIGLARRILTTRNPKGGHNVLDFDNPALRGAGIEVQGVIIHDTLEMWRRYQPDLPGGLQFVATFVGFPYPWKHLAAIEPEHYGCCDVDVPQRIMEWLPERMKQKGCWRSYERHVLQLDPILTRMSERGIPINDQKRVEFGHTLDRLGREVEEEIQGLVPEEVRPWHPKEGYKKEPKEAVEGGVTQHGKKPAIWRRKEVEVPVPFDPSEEEPAPVRMVRWVKVQPFNPNSTDQILNYIRLRRKEDIERLVARGLRLDRARDVSRVKIPHDPKTGSETTVKLELALLAKATGDDFYNKVIERREITKLKGTYVEGFAPGPDGRVHPRFGQATGTGQFTSRSPNSQNVPKVGKNTSPRYKSLATEFRGIIEAQPGHWLIEADWKSAHALTLGFEAQDPDYCVHPGTRLLMNDFTWKPASEVKTGDEVVGFDENPTKGRKRRLHKAVVEDVRRIVRPAVLIETDKGTVVCSTGHKWLSRNGDNAHLRWIRATDLRVGNRIAYFIRPWETADDADGGYVAGILDGEGTYSNTALSFAQKPGAVAEKAVQILEQAGFKISSRENNHGVINFAFIGEAFSALRAIGMYRPIRLLSKLVESYPGMTLNSSRHFQQATIRKIEFLGEREVIAIATSTDTFIAEGMQSHNCRIARIDVHSFFAVAGLLKLEDPFKLFALSDEELKARLKWYRKNWHDKTGVPFEDIRNTKAKPAILGYGFAMGPVTLLHSNPESYTSLRETRLVLGGLDRLFPRQPKYRSRIREQAARQTYLISRHGAIRWFFDVGYFDPIRGLWVNGDDAEACVAFGPANDAFGDMKDKMLLLDGWNESYDVPLWLARRATPADSWLERAELINQIHDALKFHAHGSIMDDLIPVLKDVMERPDPILVDPVVAPGGLWIEVEIKVGKNWAQMEEIDPKTGWRKKE